MSLGVGEGGNGLKRVERWFLILTAVLCGAAVMEVEILGARVVSPWFGVSLFVWTALITVTLLSLSIGYYVGGLLADRRGSVRLLGLLVIFAGGLLLLVPLLRGPVLKSSLTWGVRGGAMLAAALLFGPALTLLGTVTPFAAKLFLRDTRETGRTVGRLAALSTAGSFLGTVATGFWIIPAFHMDQIAAGTGVLLIALGAAGLWTSTGTPLLLLLPLPALLIVHAPPLADVVQPSGTRARVVCRKGSFYGQVSVVDYTFPPRHTREMLIGGIIQGGVDMIDGRGIYPYTYCLEMAALHENPLAHTALVIGLGPGVVPMRLAEYGLSGTVVEIDPVVVDMAKQYFAFAPGPFSVEVGDGRYFLERSPDRFDLVLLDAFSAENEPAHLLTYEAFLAVKKRLTGNGVFAINLSGMAPGPGADNRVVDTVMHTLGEVFPRVVAYTMPSAEAGQVTDFTIVASLSSKRPTAEPSFLPVHPVAAQSLVGFLSKTYLPGSAVRSVYTDDWAPVEAQGADAKIVWRRLEIATTPSEILLN